MLALRKANKWNKYLFLSSRCTRQHHKDRRFSKDFSLLHQHPVRWQLVRFQGRRLPFSPDPGRIYSASPFQTGKLSTSLSRKALYPFTNAEYEISWQPLRGSAGSFRSERKVKVCLVFPKCDWFRPWKEQESKRGKSVLPFVLTDSLFSFLREAALEQVWMCPKWL